MAIGEGVVKVFIEGEVKIHLLWVITLPKSTVSYLGKCTQGVGDRLVECEPKKVWNYWIRGRVREDVTP